MSNRVYRCRSRDRLADPLLRRELRLGLLRDSILDQLDRLGLGFDEGFIDDLENIREDELFAFLGLLSQLGYFSLLAFLSRDC